MLSDGPLRNLKIKTRFPHLFVNCLGSQNLIKRLRKAPAFHFYLKVARVNILFFLRGGFN